MKRALPFLIIAVVAFLTVGIAAWAYRVKTKPAPIASAGAATTSMPPEKPDDPFLHVRGPRSAPVTLEIYGDFQCPSCAVVSQSIDELQKEYASKMRIIFHEYPLEMHQHAAEAALVAEAAGVQGKFWEMHDLLYQYQPVWSRINDPGHFFESYAEQIGLDVARFNVDRRAADLRTHVIEDGKAGEKRGVQNTPTIFINGRELHGPFARENLQQAIDAALATTRKP